MAEAISNLWQVAFVTFGAIGFSACYAEPQPLGVVLILIAVVCAANAYLCRIAHNTRVVTNSKPRVSNAGDVSS